MMSVIKPPNGMAIEIRDVRTIWGPTGLRSRGPEETFSNLSALCAKLDIHTIQEIPEDETHGVSVFKIQREKPDSAVDKMEQMFAFRFRAFGKGLDPAQARVSGIMELIERYSANENGALELIDAPYREVSGQAVDLRLLLSLLETGSQLPEQLIADTIIKWCWGYSLVSRKPVLVPAFTTFYPYMERPFRVKAKINGLASGTSIEEAILHGILELVERDAFQESIIEPESLDLGEIEMVAIDDFARKHMPERFNECLKDHVFTFSIKNRKLGLEIPAFCSAVLRMDYYNRHSDLKHAIAKGKDLILKAGRGASLDPRIALLRSFAELAELLYRHPERERLPFLKSDGRHFKVIAFEDMENVSTGTLRGDIEKIIASFSKKGLDIIIVDLTRKDYGVPMVRVIIPRLKHQHSFDLKRLRFLPNDRS
jgi:thioglycine synthase